jgi:chromosome segregation ATPase
MVKRWDRMKGINLDPEQDHVFINESYDHFLRTMYGKKFPHQFVAMVNDLLDSGIIETLDDMKKVIRYFEWKMEKNNKRVKDLTSYTAALEESLQRVKDYAVALEGKLSKSKEEARGALKTVKTKGGEVEAEGSETEATRRQIISAEDLLAQLKGEVPDEEKLIAEERAEGEIAAGDTEALEEPALERPPEMEPGASPFTPIGAPGGRRTEAEIGADEIEATPKIRAIENMIKEVKRMEALHSDEEIEKIFKAKNPPAQ